MCHLYLICQTVKVFAPAFFVQATDLFETSLLIMPVSLVFQFSPCLSVLEVLCCELFGVSGRRSV